MMRFLALTMICATLLGGRLPFVTRDDNKKPEICVDSLIEMMEGEGVWAVMREAVRLKAAMSDSAGVVVLVPAGAMVEILRDSGCAWYFVRDKNGKEGWVRGAALDIPPDEPTDTSTLSQAELETYVSVMGFDSRTKYLTVVDLKRQQTHVFKGAKHKWTLERSLTVSTGKNESPTIRGAFELDNRGLWFYSERLGSGGRFWVRFDGPYMFHSVAMDKNGNVIDDTLGHKRSSGCVRLSLADAEWFYKTVPDNTRVIIL